MNKKISVGVAASIVFIAVSITFVLTMMFSLNRFNEKLPDIKSREALYSKIAEIDLKVREYYNGEINDDNLFEAISHSFMAGIGDRYAQYYDVQDLRQFENSIAGRRVGIGVDTLPDESGYLKVYQVLLGSPAQAAGLQAGDLIISIDGIDVRTLDSTVATNMIVGDIGTTVNLGIRRNSVDSQINVVRRDFTIISVQSRMIGTNAYIRITDFNTNTVPQFEDAIDNAKSQKATGIIFDVRKNTGGSLDAAMRMLDLLLPEGVVAKKVDKNGNETVLRYSDKNEVTLPMVVLTNATTASASELFVAALRDFSKAQSVGTTTYGKAVMQETFKLSDGSAIKFTTAKINPPKTENYDGVGLKPDFEVSLSKEQEESLFTLDETSDPQLIKAIEVLNSVQVQ